MRFRFQNLESLIKKHWIFWLVSSVLIFLVMDFLVIPTEFGGQNKKWVQDFYAPFWPEISRAVWVRSMGELTNKAPEGFRDYRYDFDYRRNTRMRITSVWDRHTSVKVIHSFYDHVYTNAMTSLIDSMILLKKRHRLMVMQGSSHLEQGVREIKDALDYEKKVLAEFNQFNRVHLVSNLVILMSNQAQNLKKKKALQDRYHHELEKWYPDLFKSRMNTYQLMVEELLAKPLQPKQTPWVMRGDLHSMAFVTIEMWQRILILLTFSVLTGFALAYFWAYGHGEDLDHD